MSEPDFFRQPLAEMIDPCHPLAVLASRLPWAQVEAALAPRFARQVREGRAIAQDDLFGPSVQPVPLLLQVEWLSHLCERWGASIDLAANEG